jgi:glycosyltransferase involved in cell wall biosynthesis
MHILYIHQFFKTPRHPGITRSYEMARRFVEAGHRVTMITSDSMTDQEGTWHVTQESGIEVHWLPMPYSNYMAFGRRKQVFLKFAMKASMRVLELDADLVFATSTPLTVALPALLYTKLRGVPLVFEVRDLWPEIPIAMGGLTNPVEIALSRWMERLVYRSSARVLALSPGMAAGIGRTGYPKERVVVIPNGSDNDLFDVGVEPGQVFRAAHSWLGDRKLVVYTGTLGYVNGVGYLAETARHMLDVDPEVRFLVVGDGVEAAQVREQAEALGVLNRNFFMMGEVPKREIPPILSAATLATSVVRDLPVIWENSANKFFDALASGTPVMINYGGWQADILRVAGAGLVTDPSDTALAAAQVHAYVSDEAGVARAAVAARGLARERFDRNILTDKALKVLEDVYGDNR